MKPVELADKSPPNNSKQPRISRLILIIASLLVTLGLGYFSWGQIQLYVAQQLISNCVKNRNCADQISSLERLVKAKKSLKFFNFAHANLSAANLESANLETVNLKHANLESAYLYRANLSSTNLEHTNLSFANLYRANLSLAHLERTNLYRTNLESANLSFAYLINPQNFSPARLKLTCHWEKAFYQGDWDQDKLTWIVDEKANQQFIQQLQQDKDSDPKTPVDCSEWK